VAGIFHLEVVSPEAVLWSGEASLLVTRTTEGEIGIMAHHEPLMAALAPWDAAITPVEGPRVILAVRGGFLQVVANRVTLLTDMARLVEGEGNEAVEEARRLAASMALLTDVSRLVGDEGRAGSEEARRLAVMAASVKPSAGEIPPDTLGTGQGPPSATNA
jgi:F-type H+-transporting ATPase subunit epsilon